MHVRFFSKLITAFLIITVVAVGSGGKVRAASSDEYKAIVVNAYEKLFALQSYHMTWETIGSVSILGQNIDLVMNGECDTQVKPLLVKSVMKITVGSDDPTKKEQKITQYIEEDKGNFIIYSNTAGQWERQRMPYYGLLDEYRSYAQAITKVDLVEENEEISVFAVTMDGSCLRENFERVMSSANTKKTTLPDEFFKNIGDITYKVAINKKTGTLLKTDIDMSDMLAAMGNNIAEGENLSAAEKTVIREMFSNTKLVATVIFSKFNSIDKLSIPKEVRINSLPAKLI